jgi:two-component system phosphate regulon response regulator PhoB
LGDGSSILIVEDETDLADMLCYHLQREGYQCRRAGDGERALAEAQTQPPDLIVLDRMLPKLSGDEVAVRLKRDSRTAAVPMLPHKCGVGNQGDRDFQGFRASTPHY